jgi:hypothetical protein
MPGILLMWLVFLIFKIGYNVNKFKFYNQKSIEQKEINENFIKLYIIAILSLILSVSYTKYYTGAWPNVVIYNMLNGISNYWNYQNHLKEFGLGQFSIIKLPFILMMALNKYLLVHFSIKHIGLVNKFRIRLLIFLSFIFCANIYFSLARGTNLEVFEIGLLLIYSFLVRINTINKNAQYSLKKEKNKLFILFIAILMSIIFIYQFNLRGDFKYYVTYELRYNSDAFLAKLSPFISSIIMSFAGYFAFGPFFSAVAITNIYLKSIKFIIAGLIPYGLKIMNINSFKEELCGKVIDCGAAWQPDIMIFLFNFGLLGSVFLILILGKLFRYYEFEYYKKPDPIYIILNYFIILQMVSLPIGNLILTSSSNILTILTSIFILFIKKIKSGSLIPVLRYRKAA